MRFRLRGYVLSAAALLAVAPLFAGAQFDQLGATGDLFTLSTTPDYPAPHSSVTVSALSSQIDLANATMVVSVKGQEVYRGSIKPVAVTLGGAGEEIPVRVAITANGAAGSQTVTVVPQDVLLIPEPLSTAPALYPGKPLIPTEGSVRMIAFADLRRPSGAALSPADLSYAWTIDGVRQFASSGIGKSALIVESPLQYRSRKVSVVVQSQDGALIGGASYTLNSQNPTVRLYENDPLLGIRFERALPDSFTIARAEASVYAATYSFPINGTLDEEWFLNGSSVQTGPVVTLRPTGNGLGTASLSFVASVGNLVRATSVLSLSFGATPITNFFGL